MSNIYGVSERARLQLTYDTLIAKDGQELFDAAAGSFADSLRRSLPDFDDTTIGRVLVALAADGAQMWKLLIQSEVPLSAVWEIMMITGLHLTKDEWQPVTPEGETEPRT